MDRAVVARRRELHVHVFRVSPTGEHDDEPSADLGEAFGASTVRWSTLYAQALLGGTHATSAAGSNTTIQAENGNGSGHVGGNVVIAGGATGGGGASNGYVAFGNGSTSTVIAAIAAGGSSSSVFFLGANTGITPGSTNWMLQSDGTNVVESAIGSSGDFDFEEAAGTRFARLGPTGNSTDTGLYLFLQAGASPSTTNVRAAGRRNEPERQRGRGWSGNLQVAGTTYASVTSSTLTAYQYQLAKTAGSVNTQTDTVLHVPACVQLDKRGTEHRLHVRGADEPLRHDRCPVGWPRDGDGDQQRSGRGQGGLLQRGRHRFVLDLRQHQWATLLYGYREPDHHGHGQQQQRNRDPGVRGHHAVDRLHSRHHGRVELMLAAVGVILALCLLGGAIVLARAFVAGWRAPRSSSRQGGRREARRAPRPRAGGTMCSRRPGRSWPTGSDGSRRLTGASMASSATWPNARSRRSRGRDERGVQLQPRARCPDGLRRGFAWYPQGHGRQPRGRQRDAHQPRGRDGAPDDPREPDEYGAAGEHLDDRDH